MKLFLEMNSKTRIFICILLLICSNTNSQGQAFDLNSFLNQAVFQEASIAIDVLALEEEKIILEHNAQRALIPASVVKLLTANAAIQYLDLDATFETSMQLNGMQDGSIFYGDLIVTGGGDPTLGSSFPAAIQLSAMVQKIQQFLTESGITCVMGHVQVNSSFFKLPAYSNSVLEEDRANYYGGACYGLNYQENSFDIIFRTGRTGQRAEVLDYNTEVVDQLENQVVAKGSRDLAYVYQGPSPGLYVVQGQLPTAKNSYTVHAALPNPPAYFGRQLLKALQAVGIEFNGQNAEVIWNENEGSSSIIKSWKFNSPSYRTICKEMLHRSHNLFAEALFRRCKKEDYNHLQGQVDGSGIGYKNKIKARSMTQDILKVYRANKIESLFDMLPRNAQEGTVRSVLKSHPGKLWLKSGSMSGIKSYAGIMHSKKHQGPIAFAIIVNGYQGNATEINSALLPFFEYLIRLQ